VATIYKRGDKWWARAQRKGVEHRTPLETRDKRVAEKRFKEWLDRLEAEQWGDRARVAFRTAAKSFVTDYLPTLKPASAERYGVSLQWLSDKFQDVYIDEIGREELSGFETWRRGLGVSNPTIRRDLACLSSIFTFCEDQEWIDDGKNPVPGFLRRRAKRGLKEADSRKRYLSEDEESLLLNHTTPAVLESVCVAIDTGLRATEMFTLTWPQINFSRGTITTSTDTKSGKSRTVPLPDRSAQLLAQKKKLVQAEEKKTGVAPFFVFAHEDGSRMLRQNKGLEGAVKRACKADREAKDKEKIGFDPDLRWHDLRRTAGCRWLQRDGRSMEEVSRMLGHSSIKVTEKTYAFLDEEKVAAAIAAQKQAHRAVERPAKQKKTR